MKGQTALEAELAKYGGIFFEGFFEILFVAIISVMAVGFINAFNGIPGGTQSVNLIVEYTGLVFFASLVVNFIKGVVASFEAFITVLGLIAGLWVLGGAVAAIAPSSILEVIVYIIAAIIGIGVGAYIRGQN